MPPSSELNSISLFYWKAQDKWLLKVTMKLQLPHELIIPNDSNVFLDFTPSSQDLAYSQVCIQSYL